MSKAVAEQVYDSSAAVVDSAQESVLLNHGEYTVHPMSTCSEDEVAVLFAKVCQRNNPVLQGRPFKDLELLGRAMFRKSAKLGMGQVTKHEGKAVGLGCCWDFAEGGVWGKFRFGNASFLGCACSVRQSLLRSSAQDRQKDSLRRILRHGSTAQFSLLRHHGNVPLCHGQGIWLR